MTDKTEKHKSTIIGLIALLPLLTIMLFFVKIIETETIIKIHMFMHCPYTPFCSFELNSPI